MFSKRGGSWGGEPNFQIEKIAGNVQASPDGFEHRRMAVDLARVLQASPSFFLRLQKSSYNYIKKHLGGKTRFKVVFYMA